MRLKTSNKKTVQVSARNFLIALSLILLILPVGVLAQVVILTPTVGGGVVASAPDYATEVLGNPWDMDSRADLAEYIQHADYGTGLSDYSDYTFTDQRLGYRIFSNSSNLAFFHLLSPGQPGTNPLGKNGQVFPIKSANYRYLIIRAWANRAGKLRILWNIGSDYTRYARTYPMDLYSGWYTYVIDLATFNTTSGPVAINPSWLANPNISGLRIDTYKNAASDPNIDMSIDWIRLVGEAASTFAVNYNFTAQGTDTLFSLFLDDDNSPFNGYTDQVLMAGAGGASVNYDPTFAPPGSFKVLGVSSDDFATLHGIPWRMTSLADIENSQSVNNAAVAGGAYTGTASSTSAYIDLNLDENTIDTTKFRFLSIALDSNTAGNTEVRWYNSAGAQLGSAQQFAAAGASVIDIDLQAAGGWNGQVATLRIYPKFGQTNYNFSVDFVTLRANGHSAAEPALPAVVVSPGDLVINQPPQIDIKNPNPRGGADFAADVQGKPWNMSNITDVASVQNVSEAWIYPNNYMNERQGDFFCAQNNSGNEDPIQVSFQTTRRAEAATKIDADLYKNATIEFFITREQDVVNGSVLRMIGWNMERDSREINGDDVMIPHIGPGWVTITQDLTKLKLEQIIHPPGSFPNPPWAGLFEIFRVDVHEFSEPTWYCIDSIQLRADHRANARFALAYQGQDPDSDPAAVTVSWYYSNQETTSSGTHIATRSMAENSRVVLWNTANIPNGTYWIHARINDGLSEVRRIGHRLVIDHTLEEDQTLPVIELEHPLSSSSWRRTLRLKGYALDDRQIALVEVLFNNQLLHTFVPSLFNKAARDQFPEYADSSRAGFDERIDISGLAFGQYTVKVRAYDTSGNFTDEDILINRLAGNDQSFPADPQVNEARIAIPLDGQSTRQTMSGSYRAKKKQLKLNFENMHACNDFQVVGHFNLDTLLSDLSQATVFYTSGPTARKFSITAKKVKGFARVKGQGDGQLVFGAVCDGQVVATKRINFRKGVPAVKRYEGFIKMLGKKISRAVRKRKRR